jgi:hypothetical protein
MLMPGLKNILKFSETLTGLKIWYFSEHFLPSV